MSEQAGRVRTAEPWARHPASPNADAGRFVEARASHVGQPVRREKQSTGVEGRLAPSGERDRPPGPGNAEESSMTRVIAVLSIVLVTGGLAALYVWMTLNDAFEGRASGGQVALALSALVLLLALLAWCKRVFERWMTRAEYARDRR
uniref:Uncharacterized protein n=2 Tax=Thermorudis TaxID=1649508 RepID=A0A831TB52_9BACT